MRISGQGLIRLSLDELLSIRIEHLLTRLDRDGWDRMRACGRPTVISGFTEWVTHTPHPVSLGWDWCLVVRGAAPGWVRTDMPRTNVLMVDAQGRDLPWRLSLHRLATVVDSLPWPGVVTAAVCTARPEHSTYQGW
jgi:hypothetical protein